MPYSLRTLGPSDLESLYALGSSTSAFDLTDETRFFSRDYLQRWLAAPGDDVLIAAFDGADLVGFVLCDVLRGSWAHWHSIFVCQQARHTGVGTALFERVCQELVAKGVRYCSAYVRDARLAEFLDAREAKAGERFTFWEWSAAR